MSEGMPLGSITEISGEESVEKLEEAVAEELKKISATTTPICRINLVKKSVGEIE